MKKSVITLICCAFVAVGFSQNVFWEKDYLSALETASTHDAVVVYFFTNENNKSLERSIKSDILKSEAFKNAYESMVILTVDASPNSKNTKYNQRLISAYNSENAFPSIKVVKPRSIKTSQLLTNFDDKTVEAFINDVRSLK